MFYERTQSTWRYVLCRLDFTLLMCDNLLVRLIVFYVTQKMQVIMTADSFDRASSLNFVEI